MCLMKKSLLIFTFLLSLFQNVHGQSDSALFQALSGKYITDTPTFTVLLYSSDCFKCKLPLSHALDLLKKEDTANKYRRLIITDNYSYGNAFNKDNEIGATVIYDTGVFSHVTSALKSVIVISVAKSYTVIGSKEISKAAVIRELREKAGSTKAAYNNSLFYEFEDSVISPNNFSSAITPFGFALYDGLLQTGICISNQKQLNYLKPVLTDSDIVNNLPDRVDKNRFAKVAYSETVEGLTANSIPLLHINSIANFDAAVYCIFSINRVYADKTQADNFGIFTTYFLATKKIKTPKDYESVFDIDTYKNIYYIDSFSFKNETYPIGSWINFHPAFINDSTFQINVNHQNNIKRKIEFGGLATVVLKKDGTAEMTGIDETAKDAIMINNTVMLNGKKFFIKKEMTDESQGIGKIKISVL